MVNCLWRKDVATHAYVFDLTGKLENEITLPGLGTASGFRGLSDDKYVFYSFTSFNFPSTTYKYDIATKKSSVFHKIDIPGFNPNAYETKQVFFNSKDGTRVPMFLVYKKGITLDGNNPTVLYGYGGFNIVTEPNFNSLRLALLEQGVVYASCNMRGGGEYGEKWHLAGTKLQKQNVFDDFIAAAEYLVANKYTSSNKLAIQGGSNGGLLVGAVSNQRPDLFKAVVEQAGVMDMLRFQKFTIGWNWIADYGSSEANEAEFKALYAYSPIHNVKPGTKYPATLITTADHDDRVVPHTISNTQRRCKQHRAVMLQSLFVSIRILHMEQAIQPSRLSRREICLPSCLKILELNIGRRLLIRQGRLVLGPQASSPADLILVTGHLAGEDACGPSHHHVRRMKCASVLKTTLSKLSGFSGANNR